jgi:ssDNA thymidine ADP-ribosyltransferase, DarT
LQPGLANYSWHYFRGHITSISFPNYKLFYTFRQRDMSAEWVLIALHPSVMWETRTVFCTANAALTEVSSIPLKERQGLMALKRLFDDFGSKPRANLEIPDRYTTNRQAEVLLMDGAPKKYIRGLVAPTSAIQTRLAERFPGVPVKLNGGFFNGRSDFEHWR